MDIAEAKAVLRGVLGKYRGLLYRELCGRIGEQDCFGVEGESGVGYQVEIQFFWDDVPGGNIRVMGAVEDGFSASRPYGESFIVGADGTLVG